MQDAFRFAPYHDTKPSSNKLANFLRAGTSAQCFTAYGYPARAVPYSGYEKVSVFRHFFPSMIGMKLNKAVLLPVARTDRKQFSPIT